MQGPFTGPRGGSSVALGVALAVALSFACGTEPEPEPTGIEVTGPAFRIAVGATAKLTAAVQGAEGPLTGASVTWTSRDTTSVTVRADGTATAVRPGESWIVGQSGTVTDSALVEVEFSVAEGNGRARIRTAGRESILEMIEPIGFQSDYLGLDESDWYVEGTDQEADTIVGIYFVAAPTGQRTALSNIWVPSDTASITLPAPIAFLEMYPTANTVKVVPLRGAVDAAIVQNVPPGFREGRMRARVVGSGRAWLGTFTQGGITWTETQEVFDVAADILPPFIHESIGTSSGQLTGTTPAGAWRNRLAFWLRSSLHGRNWVLLTSGPPLIRLYSPGTASVDLGTDVETTRAYGLLTDSVRAYSGTATGGRIEITRYTAPPASDLFGEIRGRATLTGTGTTQGGAATPFSGTLDFAAPVLGTPPAVGPERTARSSARRWLQGRPWSPRGR